MTRLSRHIKDFLGRILEPALGKARLAPSHRQARGQGAFRVPGLCARTADRIGGQAPQRLFCHFSIRRLPAPDRGLRHRSGVVRVLPDWGRVFCLRAPFFPEVSV